LSYEKPRYERSSYENRTLPVEEFLTPPGVEHRYRDRDRDVGLPGIRDRDMGMPSMRDRDRDIGPPGVRDRDLGVPLWDSRDRASRDDLPAGRDIERSRDKDRDRDRDVRDRDGDRDRDRGRGDYYETDHRRSYDKSYGTYSSPDVKKRKQSVSPGQGRHERYSSSERHHRRGGDRRKNSGSVQTPQGGKENRHVSQQQPVETVVDAAGSQRDREKDTQKRERVLVEVRKEPSVDRLKKEDKAKKEEDGKKSKEKKKKKKEKEPEGEKLKKKRRKEKKEGKKEGPESQERTKAMAKGTERKLHHKEKEGEAEEDKVKEKPTVTSAPLQLALTSGSIVEKVKGATTLRTFDAPPTESIVDGLYGDMEDTRIDDNVIANYGKVMVDEVQDKSVESDTADKGGEGSQQLAEGVEVRVKSEGGLDPEVAVKPVTPDTVKANVMLAPLPEPSKWELDEEFTPGSSFEKKEAEDGAAGGSQADKTAGKVVTSEVLKRAENAIFQKAINAIRPIEPPKKASSDRKVYTSSEKKAPGEVAAPETAETRKVPEKEAREARKTVNSIQITIPTAGHVERSVEIASLESGSQQVGKGKGKLDRSKFSAGGSTQWADGTDSTSPHRVPAKERLGARVDGDGDRKKDDKESRRHRSRSESRERKHSASKKGLKSAVEKKRTISRSRSRSPYHRKPADRKDSKYGEEVRRYASGDSRSKRGDREGRYGEVDRDRRPLERGGGDNRRREHSESNKWEQSREKREVVKSPERRGEGSGSHENRGEKVKPRPKEEREKSAEKGKVRHKAKKKTKSRSESRSRKKSVSDKESKRGKKKDKKHKKEKGKKHKQREEKKEGESGKDKEEESAAVKEAKAGGSGDAAVSAAGDANGKAAAAASASQTADQSKDKPRRSGRRNPRLASDRKKSTLDEASFEPDYDASSSVDTDAEDGGDNEKKVDGSADKKSESNVSPGKKRDRSASIDPAATEQKRQKLEQAPVTAERSAAGETGKKTSNKASGAKAGSAKRRDDRSPSSSDSSDDDSSDDDDDDSSSGSSSSSDDDSSDDSSVRRRRKKKSHHRRHSKRSKKSSRRMSNSSSDTDSESESASSSDSEEGRGRKGGGRSSKKHRHRNKVSKKKKKSSKHR
jgi:hypothetical protein